MEAPETPFETPKSNTTLPQPPASGRRFLRSPGGRILVRVAIAVLVFIFVSKAGQTYRVMDLYGVERNTLMWLVCVLSISSYFVATVCLLLTPWFWSWAVLLWSFLVPGIALVGFGMGLSPDFVLRWDVLLPWGILLVTFVFEKPFGKISSTAA